LSTAQIGSTPQRSPAAAAVLCLSMKLTNAAVAVELGPEESHRRLQDLIRAAQLSHFPPP
jgi:hypothetical protein